MEPAKVDHAVRPRVSTAAPEVRGVFRDRSRRFSARGAVPYGYLSPTMLLIFVLMVIPIAMVVSYSFKDNVIVEQNPVFAGLANYTTVLTDPNFLAALENTFIFITLSTVAHLVLGLTFATMLNTPLLSGVTKAIFRVIYRGGGHQPFRLPSKPIMQAAQLRRTKKYTSLRIGCGNRQCRIG